MFSVKKSSFQLVLPLLLIALVSGFAIGCGGDDGGSETAEAGETSDSDGQKKGKDGEDEGEDKEEAVPVEVAAVSRGSIESVLRFSTNLEAEREVSVFSQAARQVRSLLVEEGDDVRRGQVLLRLQDDEQRTALARVEGQLAKARREYERQENLFEQQLISEQTFNQAIYDQEQLELALRDAQRELGYTEVVAPISGTITARHVNVGDQVTLNALLFDIVDFDSIVARVYVPEKDLARVSKGLDARVFAAARGGAERRGSILRVAPRVDPRSGTVKVTVSVPRNQGLLPGMYVSVELITDVHDNALLLSKRALVHDGDQRYVFRLRPEGDRVERLMIEAALEDRDYVEPAGEVAEGDKIVVAGQAGLKDGALVRVVSAGGEAEPLADTAATETVTGP